MGRERSPRDGGRGPRRRRLNVRRPRHGPWLARSTRRPLGSRHPGSGRGHGSWAGTPVARYRPPRLPLHRSIRDYCAAHQLEVIGEVPYDPTLLDAERAARPPIDDAPDAPAIRALRELAARLTAPTA